jgi:hypothetical protein
MDLVMGCVCKWDGFGGDSIDSAKIGPGIN